MEFARIIKMTYKGVTALAVLALVSGILFHLFEGESILRSFYWALITLTTVGYEILVPKPHQVVSFPLSWPVSAFYFTVT